MQSSEDPGKRAPMSNAQLGMFLFLLSLSVLFAASLVACAITRAQAPLWRTHEMPGLPLGLAGSTLIIGALSGSLEWANRLVRENRLRTLERALWAALALGALFLLVQSFNWVEMARGYRASSLTLYPFTFHLLTGLHALHVLGGFVPLGYAIMKAGRREYSSSRHEGLKLTTQYWHFLGVVWLILLGALWWMSV